MQPAPFRQPVRRFVAGPTFIPFVIDLATTQLTVHRPHTLSFDDDLAAYSEDDGSVQYFDASIVVRVMSKFDPADEPLRNGAVPGEPF